jgi:hypothetical protein
LQDPSWEAYLTKISSAKQSKLSGDYETSLKVEMSMAADAIGLQLMQLNESFMDLDSEETGFVTFDQIATGFVPAATTAGLHLMMDTQLVSKLLGEIKTQHGTLVCIDCLVVSLDLIPCGRCSQDFRCL